MQLGAEVGALCGAAVRSSCPHNMFLEQHTTCSPMITATEENIRPEFVSLLQVLSKLAQVAGGSLGTCTHDPGNEHAYTSTVETHTRPRVGRASWLRLSDLKQGMTCRESNFKLNAFRMQVR